MRIAAQFSSHRLPQKVNCIARTLSIARQQTYSQWRSIDLGCRYCASGTLLFLSSKNLGSTQPPHSRTSFCSRRATTRMRSPRLRRSLTPSTSSARPRSVVSVHGSTVAIQEGAVVRRGVGPVFFQYNGERSFRYWAFRNVKKIPPESRIYVIAND